MIGGLITFAVGCVAGWFVRHFYTKWKIKRLLNFLSDPLDETIGSFFDVFKKLGIDFKEKEE